MKIKKEYLLLLIFLLTVSFRFYFVLNTPNFSDDHAYFNIKHSKFISENFKPMNYDPLSYGGREISYPPLFYYLISLFSLFPILYKIVPAILISLLVYVAYYFTLKITNNKEAALYSSLMTAFIPILIKGTLNKISIYSVIIPLIFFMFYCLIESDKEKYLNLFIVLCFVLPFISSIAFIVTLSLTIYSFLALSENMNIGKLKREAIIFSIFLTILIEFIIYKKAFISLGASVIWNNVPKEILANYFQHINILDLIFQIGILPFILGIMGIVFGIYTTQKHSVFLLISLIFSIAILLSMRLIDFHVGMIFLGVSLAMISALSFDKFFQYVRITKFSKFEGIIKVILLILIVVSLIVPSYYNASKVIDETVTTEEINLLKEISRNTDERAKILSSVEEGNLVSVITNRKTAMDNAFLFVPNIDQKYNELSQIYTTQSKVKALNFIHKYRIDYIYFSERAKKFYNIKDLNYIHDEECFKLYRGTKTVQVYKVVC